MESSFTAAGSVKYLRILRQDNLLVTLSDEDGHRLQDEFDHGRSFRWDGNFAIQSKDWENGSGDQLDEYGFCHTTEI